MKVDQIQLFALKLQTSKDLKKYWLEHITVIDTGSLFHTSMDYMQQVLS